MMSQIKALSQERFMGLEWLRFLLGCYVMIYHTAHIYPQIKHIRGLAEVTSMGFFATSTFFILSGFLLTHVYVRTGRLNIPKSHFWQKRLYNLYPIHIMALLASFVVIIFMNWMNIPPGDHASMRFVIYDTNEALAQTHPELFHHDMNDTQLIFNLVLQFVMLQAWNPYFLTFNAPLWSLSTLFFFYLLFPWLAPKLINTRHYWRWLTVIWLIYLTPPTLFVLTQNYGMPYTGLLQRGPIFRLPEFLAGILGYGLFQQAKKRHVALSRAAIRGMAFAVLSSFIIATYLFTHAGQHYWYFLLHNGLLLPFQLVFVYLCAQMKTPKSQWLNQWLPRLGASSLPIFAFHVPLFGFWSTMERFIRSNPWSCSVSDSEICLARAAHIQLSITGYILFLMATIGFAMLFQAYFVKPIRMYLQRRFIGE